MTMPRPSVSCVAYRCSALEAVASTLDNPLEAVNNTGTLVVSTGIPAPQSLKTASSVPSTADFAGEGAGTVLQAAKTNSNETCLFFFAPFQRDSIQ